MHVRILDLDGGVRRQTNLIRRCRPTIAELRDWGPRIRLACGHGTFAAFERRLAERTGTAHDAGPNLSFVGSGDFHHVSLALLRRLRRPFNLLVLDKHPDWMRGVPLLHCGTWLYHAAQLPLVRRVFHVGGALDFDNAYRWLAPWPMIRAGKIVVAPALGRFRGRWWRGVPHRPLRRQPEVPADETTLDEWIAPYRAELGDWPLYVSLDKDVLTEAESVVNWDSGHLTTPELFGVLDTFTAAAGEWAGMDVVGDWSAVRVRGLLRRWLHWTEHPRLRIDPREATRRNERLNLLLAERVGCAGGVRSPLGHLSKAASGPD